MPAAQTTTASDITRRLAAIHARRTPVVRPREPSALEKFIAPLTFGERVSAAAAMSFTTSATFGESMENWVDYTDVVNQWFPEKNKWEKMALSLAFGIALDPVTYIGGIGALTKLGKAGVAAGKTTTVVRELLVPTKTSKFLPGIDEVGRVLREDIGRITDVVKVPISELKYTEQADKGLRQLFEVRIPFVKGAGFKIPFPKQVNEMVKSLSNTLEKTRGGASLTRFGRNMFLVDGGSQL